jgi:hypothetical protein
MQEFGKPSKENNINILNKGLENSLILDENSYICKNIC